ncbi:hypothetical protein CO2235_20027 [Cupriavidus oxalaticus]|uniref:Uncharacterized protein n=1 Tax=Cupriavidus oxalaticus TaxID=96344 RepID=A0A375G5L2_9BURK|nr:hypothetical protein CO2235_20027 [Cupriavidus oxalaticus]
MPTVAGKVSAKLLPLRGAVGRRVVVRVWSADKTAFTQSLLSHPAVGLPGHAPRVSVRAAAALQHILALQPGEC